MIRKYINVGNPIQIVEFDEDRHPMGWHRLESVQKRLKEDSHWRSAFTEAEIKQIEEGKITLVFT
jgi:peptidyl-tRNA hydrolase